MLYVWILSGSTVYSIISGLLLGKSVGVCIGDAYLLSLHAYLRRRGITTYEYIVENRNKKLVIHINTGEGKESHDDNITQEKVKPKFGKTMPTGQSFDVKLDITY